jgi:hypothetical protein
MSYQDEPISHAATMTEAGDARKTMTQSSTAADLQFAMDRCATRSRRCASSCTRRHRNVAGTEGGEGVS